MLGLVGLTVAAFLLVGDLASRHEEFDWELASIFGTAVGTTLLALATGWLAYSTRSEVRATQKLAELTQEGQAASERPLVLLVGTSFSGTERLREPWKSSCEIPASGRRCESALKRPIQATPIGGRISQSRSFPLSRRVWSLARSFG